MPAGRSTGYVYTAFSATGILFMPTTARFALERGSDMLSVAFACDIVGMHRLADIRVGFTLVLVSLFRFEKMAPDP